MATFRDLELVTYCPRKYYYRDRADDHGSIPDRVERRREIAFEYERLLDDRSELADAPLAVDPGEWADRMATVSARCSRFEALLDPAETDTVLRGETARGVAHKVLEEPPTPVIVVTGTPPETGVYEPQSVRATAAADALADREGRPVETAIVEYPAAGRIREIEIGPRRRGQYRAARQAIASIDGPPGRIDNRSKCEPCEYREQCGTPTRSVSSLLGL